MEFQYQIVNEKKGSSAKTVLLSVLLAALVAGLVCFGILYLNKTPSTDTTVQGDTDTDLAEQISKLQEENKAYADAIDKLNEEISALENTNKQVAVVVSESGKTVADVAEEVLPSIVYISVYVPKYSSSSYFSFNSSAASFSGSGIIYSESEGKTYIITNYHVVEYTNEYEDVTITVKTSDETEYSATFIGGDSKNDIAVISIEATGLKLAKTSESNTVRVGDVAIVIGNPLGEEYAGSVTVGYISALNRNVSSENTAESLIQTDAAINPGNSGGALLDLNGNVIGITSSKIVSTNVEGIGFAISFDYARSIIDNLIEYGYVKDRPYIGISDGIEITKQMSRYYNLPTGFYLTEIQSESPIVLAGLRVKDIILTVDGTSVSDLSSITSIIKTHKPGDTVTVTYYRNDREYTTTITIGEDKGV